VGKKSFSSSAHFLNRSIRSQEGERKGEGGKREKTTNTLGREKQRTQSNKCPDSFSSLCPLAPTLRGEKGEGGKRREGERKGRQVPNSSGQPFNLCLNCRLISAIAGEEKEEREGGTAVDQTPRNLLPYLRCAPAPGGKKKKVGGKERGGARFRIFHWREGRGNHSPGAHFADLSTFRSGRGPQPIKRREKRNEGEGGGGRGGGKAHPPLALLARDKRGEREGGGKGKTRIPYISTTTTDEDYKIYIMNTMSLSTNRSTDGRGKRRRKGEGGREKKENERSKTTHGIKRQSPAHSL